MHFRTTLLVIMQFCTGGVRSPAVAAAVMLLLTACGSASTGGAAASGGSRDSKATGFPVTIEHAFGSTKIEKEPKRVVTWGWGSADAAIALGVIPVAIPKQVYGGDEQGVLQWIREKLEADGARAPAILPDSAEPPLEAIAAAEPDLILAPYSGITREEYDLLSQMAPTVAYPDEPWATPWRETIEIVGQALGKANEAEELLVDIDRQIAEAAKAHPELEGKTVALVWNTPEAFYVYKPADARVAFTEDLGMTSAPSVEELGSGDETFFYTFCQERLDELESDVLVSYADTPEASKAFLDSPAAKLMPQVRSGAVAEVMGSDLIAAVSPPTALSVTWGLDEYVSLLSEAARKADEG